jgi:hypothetical protein
MKNLLINYISGDRFLESLDLEIHHKSAYKLKNVDRFVIVNNLSPENIKLLKGMYDNVIHTDVPFYYIYFAFHDLLSKYVNDYDYAMYMDTRDVLIQKNPFDYMISKPEKDLFLVCEGMKVIENSCNNNWHNLLSSTQVFPNSEGNNNLVTNGGTVGGKVKDFLYILMLVITNINRKASAPVTDQCILTSLYPYLKDLKHVDYCHPYTSDFCATGEAIKWGNIKVNFDGKQVLNQDNQPYYLFHQWDRTEYAEAIRNNFKNTLSFVI